MWQRIHILEMIDANKDKQNESEHKIVERLKKFTSNDLKECYVMYDVYWDDGLDDKLTLEKIKQKLLEDKK